MSSRSSFCHVAALSLGVLPLLTACTGAGEKGGKGEKQLYDLIGGEAAIARVVDDFVARASQDPAVNFTRQGTGKEWPATAESVARLKKLLVQFIGKATGGPVKYEGRDMKTVHAGMKVTAAEFDALVGHLRAALERAGVARDLAERVMSIAGSTRKQIVEQ